MVQYPAVIDRQLGPTCIDLFSGAGGLAEGFRQAGWSILAANDSDANARSTFRLNFPEAVFFEGSVADLAAADLLRAADLKRGELGVLIGGPPCQSFSYNNHERSASDKRARLFKHYLHIVARLHPKTLVMENVPGMLTIGGGRIVEEIQRSLSKLNYDSVVRILYAEDFGVPQARRRAFVLASRIGAAADLLPQGTHGPSAKPSEEASPMVHRWTASPGVTVNPFVTVSDAISDLPILRNGGGDPLREYVQAAKTPFQRLLREGAVRLCNHVCHQVAPAMLARIQHVREGGNWRNIPHDLLPAGMQRAKKKDHTKRYGRLSRRGLASTILTKCDPHWGAYIHPTQSRTISVREAARLQGFPDTFQFAGDRMGRQYEQVGNAVPVPLASAIALAVRLQVENAPRARAKTAA